MDQGKVRTTLWEWIGRWSHSRNAVFSKHPETVFPHRALCNARKYRLLGRYNRDKTDGVSIDSRKFHVKWIEGGKRWLAAESFRMGILAGPNGQIYRMFPVKIVS